MNTPPTVYASTTGTTTTTEEEVEEYMRSCMEHKETREEKRTQESLESRLVCFLFFVFWDFCL
jgi:hypothetical protein